MPKVYIAGPYTKPDPKENTLNAIIVAEKVARLGFIPFIPHLTYYWEQEFHHEYNFWLEQDIEWLKCCDIVIRIPGESLGADKEIVLAKQLKKKVYTLASFLKKYK